MIPELNRPRGNSSSSAPRKPRVRAKQQIRAYDENCGKWLWVLTQTESKLNHEGLDEVEVVVKGATVIQLKRRYAKFLPFNDYTRTRYNIHTNELVGWHLNSL